jgi:FtsP/CotA-like multicopper oxidase with cupredoxin domain
VLLGGLATAIAAATYSIYEETLGSALPRHATTTPRATSVTGIALPLLPRDDGTLENGVRTFTLKLQPGKTSFLDGQETTTWGINRAFLGPVLHANRGEKVRMLVENQVGEPTTMHWHGMHLPAEMDGGPFQPIAAGATWKPEWEIRQSAATLWFHPHFFGKTRDHVMKGLAGVFAIHDPSEAGLPDKHGVDDFSIILQETLLNDKGQIDTSDGARVTLVNGAIAPRLELPDGPARLRLLNASDSRSFQLAFDDARPLVIVGVDGGRLNNPVSVPDVILGPGERVELIVDHADGRLLALNPDAGVANGTNTTTTTAATGAAATLSDVAADVLLQLEGGPKGAVPQTPFPSAPSPAELADPAKATVTRRLVLQKGGPGLTIGIETGSTASPTGTTDTTAMPNMPGMPSTLATPGTTVPGAAKPPTGAGLQQPTTTTTTTPPSTVPGGPGSSGAPPTTKAATIPGVPAAAMEEPSFACQIDTTEVWAIENKTDVVHYFHVHDVQFKVVDRDGKPPIEHELGRKDVVRIEATSTVRIALDLKDYVDPTFPYMFHCHMLTHEDQGMMGHFTVVDGKAAPA